MKLLQLLRFALLATVVYSSTSFAAVLDVQGGALFGASGVNVNGTLYDVQFLDGTCIDLFDGCDQNTDFPFTNPLDLTDDDLGLLAMEALLDQVLIDSPMGNFDSEPALVNGCERECFIFTPHQVSPGAGTTAFSAGNWPNENSDSFGAGGGPLPTDDLSTSPRGAYAVWTVSSVPVPAAVWLFGSGLLGLIGIARRKV